MNYSSAVLNSTLGLLSEGNISALVSKGDSIAALAAVMADAMFLNANGNSDIKKNLASKLNLTGEEINDFFNKATIEEVKNINRTTTHTNGTGNEHGACEFYCNGVIKDVFTNYKGMHGYISLAVIVLNNCIQFPIGPLAGTSVTELMHPFHLQICIFGTIANILNIIVLTRKDMSKTPINTILKWLSVADMFVMIEYIPFTIYTTYIRPSMKLTTPFLQLTTFTPI